MFGRKQDVSSLATDDVVTQERRSQDLNHEVDLVVRANTFAGMLFPKPGHLVCGDVGLEFVADNQVGYIQIPWHNITSITVDIVGTHYVRSIRIATDQTDPLEFVVSDGQNLVRCLASHLGREKLHQNMGNFRSVGRRIGSWFKILFSRGSRA